jgi:hypothetical protein
MKLLLFCGVDDRLSDMNRTQFPPQQRHVYPLARSPPRQRVLPLARTRNRLESTVCPSTSGAGGIQRFYSQNWTQNLV